MHRYTTKSEPLAAGRRRAVLVIGLVFICTSLPAQELLILQQGRAGYAGTEDTHIFVNKPGNNAGSEILLEASGNGGAADAKHALIRFDLSSLPVDLQIDSAPTKPSKPKTLRRL